MNRVDTVLTQLRPANEYVTVQYSPPFATITLLNHAYGPAVGNALTGLRRAYLYKSLQEIHSFNEADKNTKKVCAVLIHSNTTRVFSIGTNPENLLDGITQGEEEELFVPSLATLNSMIEGYAIPVVAVVDGVCSSWGLELALSCHILCASEVARFRVPEVHFGVVPCGGGTLRLCRRVGLVKALGVLCSGAKFSCKQAKQIGLCDTVVSHSTIPNMLEEAKKAVLEMIRERVIGSDRQTSPHVELDMAMKYAGLVRSVRQFTRIGSVLTNRALFAWTEHKIRDTYPRDVTTVYHPLRAVQLAVRYQHNRTAYLEKEKAFYKKCATSAEGQCAQHVMWAASGPLRDYLKEFSMTTTLPPPHLCFSQNAPHIQMIAVIGAGTMGTSIAMMLLYHFRNKRIVLVEMDDARKQSALYDLKRFLEFSIAEGRITRWMKEDYLSRLQLIGSPAEPLPPVLAQCDLVIECAPEVAELKKNIFSHLDKLCKRSCIFATGSSTRRVEEIERATQRPDLVIGLHFYPPANQSPIVEVSCGPKTGRAVVHTVVELMLGCGKHTVLSYDRAGYTGARILQSGLYQAYALLEDGCLPYQVDRALKKIFRFKHGVFELEDIIGVDAAAMARRNRSEGPSSSLPPRAVYDIADRLVQKGTLGRKTGEGWYKYRYDRVTPNSRSRSAFGTTNKVDNRARYALLSTREMVPEVSRDVEILTMRVSKEKHIMRRDVDNKEIIERILLAMINEAAIMLSEGYVKHASDIDCISVFAHGFPMTKGGLLHYADHHWGPKELVRLMRVYHRSLTSHTFPAPCNVLLSMVEQHLTFEEKFPPL